MLSFPPHSIVSVTEDTRSAKEVLLGMKSWLRLGAHALNLTDFDTYVPNPGKVHRVALLREGETSHPSHMQDLVREGREAGFNKIPLVAALLLVETYAERALPCRNLFFAHHSVLTPRAFHSEKSRERRLVCVQKGGKKEVLGLRLRDWNPIHPKEILAFGVPD